MPRVLAWRISSSKVSSVASGNCDAGMGRINASTPRDCAAPRLAVIALKSTVEGDSGLAALSEAVGEVGLASVTW